MSIGSKNSYEKQYGKYINKYDGKYRIFKNINGKREYFGQYDNFQDAVNKRDWLIEHDWIKTLEVDYEKEYYKHITLVKNSQYIIIKRINGKNTYFGRCNTLEEALLWRDIVKHNNWDVKLNIKLYDLITDNPYLEDGLDYPVPERLVKKEKDSNYAEGTITKKGPQSYHVKYSSKYYCACRTYEQAYYVKKRLQECNWDKNKIPEILNDYPKWYTWLVGFYRYVRPHLKNGSHDGKWAFVLTPTNNEGKITTLVFSNLEDALWERDLYVKYDFDIETIVYCANDDNNPYYNMELPPYPERTILHNVPLKTYEDELTRMKELILEGVNTQKELSELMGINEQSIRNYLKRYNISWKDFKNICWSGEDPLELLEIERVFTPDLSVHYSDGNYIHFRTDGRPSPYIIARKGVYYGSYPNKKTAKKVVKKLKECDWDKKRLKKIHELIGFQSIVGSKRWVYENKYKGKVISYSVRHKGKDKRMNNFGTYQNKEKAEYIRDQLIDVNWNEEKFPGIKEEADKIYP